jgi:hypothetical protein
MENPGLQRTVNNLPNFIKSGKPTIPSGKQPVVDRKYTDPSSCFPKDGRYPIPSFFEYRVAIKEQELY